MNDRLDLPKTCRVVADLTSSLWLNPVLMEAVKVNFRHMVNSSESLTRTDRVL
jgi:hypothetical protein